MQPGQVAPNQNFLPRPPGPIPVSHGNVQQQVRPPRRPTLCFLHPRGVFTHALLMTLGFFSSSSFTPVPPLWPVLCAVCGGGHAPR